MGGFHGGRFGWACFLFRSAAAWNRQGAVQIVTSTLRIMPPSGGMAEKKMKICVSGQSHDVFSFWNPPSRRQSAAASIPAVFPIRFR
jgi:hypothetical protein